MLFFSRSMVGWLHGLGGGDESIQGSETDIRAKFYSMAFKQQYDEEEGEVRWLMVDYALLGDMPYY